MRRGAWSPQGRRLRGGWSCQSTHTAPLMMPIASSLAVPGLSRCGMDQRVHACLSVCLPVCPFLCPSDGVVGDARLSLD